MKRGMLPVSWLISIALLIIGFFIILALVTQFAGKVEGPAAENLCQAVNAGRFGLIPGFVRATAGSPQACKMLDQGAIPNGVYADYEPNLGAQKQIADLASRCWWMWLEGIWDDENGISADVLDPRVVIGKQCFPCYQFQVKKTVDFTGGALKTFIDTSPYRAIDTSSRCASTGVGGGTCSEKCGDTWESGLPYKTKEVSSKKCGTDKKCCVPVSHTDECTAKGGMCLTGRQDLFYTTPDGTQRAQHTWLCPDNLKCYVDRSNFMSFQDYVMKGGRGPGYIEVDKRVAKLEPGEIYTVAFFEDTGFLSTTAGITVLNKKADSIVIAKFKDISNDCNPEFGAGGS